MAMDNVCRLGKNKHECWLAQWFGGYGLPSVKINKQFVSTGSEGDTYNNGCT